MKSSSTSRQAILDRVRAVTSSSAPTGYESLPRPYHHRGELASLPCLQLFEERLREYGAEVLECAPGEEAASIAAQLRQSGKRKFLAAPELPQAWRADGFDWHIDNQLPHDEIEHCDGVVTTAFAAVAESGTIVLHHTGSQGRRVLTLLPDWHLCVLYASQVVETLPEYFARCAQPPLLATWIAGPSATADIEMTRIKGVHGPRSLHVLLVRDDQPRA